MPDAASPVSGPTAYTRVRHVGEATVTIVNEGTIPWAPRYQVPEAVWRQALPSADADGRILLGMHVAHVQMPGASILIDAGLGDPGSVWYRHFTERWSGFVPTPGLGGWMAAAGVASETITHVLITHAHEDHYAGVAVDRDGQLIVRFPRARHLLGRADWDGNPRRADATSALVLRLGLLERRGLLDLVDGAREVVPGVSMLPAPGESPGHSVVRVDSGGAHCYFLGDLVHHAAEIEHPDWLPGQTRDPDRLRASRARLYAEIAAHPSAAALFTHALPPGWGRIVTDGSGYRWAPGG